MSSGHTRELRLRDSIREAQPQLSEGERAGTFLEALGVLHRGKLSSRDWVSCHEGHLLGLKLVDHQGAVGGEQNLRRLGDFAQHAHHFFDPSGVEPVLRLFNQEDGRLVDVPQESEGQKVEHAFGQLLGADLSSIDQLDSNGALHIFREEANV
jgi:hypothetical protein